MLTNSSIFRSSQLGFSALILNLHGRGTQGRVVAVASGAAIGDAALGAVDRDGPLRPAEGDAIRVDDRSQVARSLEAQQQCLDPGLELARVTGVMDAYLAPERGPEVAAYIKNFKDRFKLEPDPFGSCYYDAAWILKQVLDKVGPDRAKIRDALKTVKDYKGVTNVFTTDELGNMVHSLAVFSIKPGTRDPVFIRTISA